MEDEEMGKVCYNEYKKSCGGLTWDKKPMMEFDEMPSDKKIHWINAGFAVYFQFERKYEIYDIDYLDNNTNN